jgi:hypothetical protein
MAERNLLIQKSWKDFPFWIFFFGFRHLGFRRGGAAVRDLQQQKGTRKKKPRGRRRVS